MAVRGMWWLILLCISGVTLTDISDGIKNLDHLVDEAIPRIVKIINDENLDPLQLDNLMDQTELSDCWLHGLSSIYRSGNCTWHRLSDEQVNIFLHVGFRSLTGSCAISKRLFIFRYKAVIHMQMSNVSSSIIIEQNGKTENETWRAQLRYLEVKLEKGLKIEAQGDTTITFLVNNLKFVYIRKLERLVKSNLKEHFQSTLHNHLNQLRSWNDLQLNVTLF